MKIKRNGSFKMKYRNSVSAAIVAFVLGISSSMAQERPASIIVNTSEGENGPMLRKAYFNDFEAATGVQIVDPRPADFSRLRASVESGKVEFSTIELQPKDAWREIELNLLEPIHDKIVDRSKFPPQTLNPYLYRIRSYSTEAFPEGGPANWNEFWDVKAFPCPRSMRNHPIDNLEAALIADGVAAGKSLSARLGSCLRQA